VSDQPWFVKAFGADYLKVYAHRDERDAKRAVDCCVAELGLDSRTRTLDLCCGAGRHLKYLLKQGVPSIGLDLSHDLLAQALADGLPEKALIQGDARELPFADEGFDRVVNLFTSFGYFDEDAENQRQLNEIARVLKHEGLVLIDHMNPHVVRANLRERSEEERNGAHIVSHRRIDEQKKRVLKQVEITFADGRRLAYEESVRLFDQHEFKAMLDQAGLRWLRSLGDFRGEPKFDPLHSPRQILIARKGE